MPTLSAQYAYIVLPDGSKAYPSDVSVTLDEAWAPYCKATVTVPKDSIDLTLIDPREGDRLTLHLQQDFGDLIYISELTAAYGGSVSAVTAAFTPALIADITHEYTTAWNIFSTALPLSTITTTYGPTVIASELTAANLTSVWRFSDTLHGTDTFNPAPSTIFQGDLGVREISEDYIAQTLTIELSSDEALAQDRYGYGSDVPFFFDTLRAAIEFMLIYADVGTYGAGKLSGTGGDYTLTEQYTVGTYFTNLSNNLWDDMIALANSCGFTLYCDENRIWHLEPETITAGTLELKDDDNITRFTRTRSRNGEWYSNVNIQYAYEVDQASDPTTPFAARRYLTLDRTKSQTVELDGATTILNRTKTRGETYEIEAINNFDARPKQEINVDVTGIPLTSGIIQSVTWQLPAATMTVELRNPQEI